MVETTTATLGVRRRLVGRWEASWNAAATRMDTSLVQLASGRTDALTGGFTLNRPLSDNATFHVSYQTQHQLSSGALPFSANFDLNQVTMGLDFRLKAIPLGQ